MKTEKRIRSLIKSLERNHHRWNETFIDEDTNKEVTIERDELLDIETTEDERNLMESIVADSSQISTEDLCVFIDKTMVFWPRHYDELYIELVRRGKDDAASYIEDPSVLFDLCEKGNKYAASELYFKYRWGDEEHGIFINHKKAKEYYDLAGDAVYDEWDDSDDPGEEDPSDYEYTLTGDASTLNAIRKMIDDLCRDYGTPGNELGMYVPQRFLMKLLVGSDTEYYRGNVLFMEGPSPLGEGQEESRLIITTEADNGYPLLYALRECFDNLEITMKETE